MTIALAIALAVYCVYECIKYALSDKRKRGSIPKVSDEQTFTAALTQLAGIHGETPKVEEKTSVSAPANKES